MFKPCFTLSLILVLALLAPGASQSLAQPAASSASPAAPGAMLVVENAGQWPEAARFQVWNSPLGPGVTWLAEYAIWLVVGVGEPESGRAGDEEMFSPSPSRPLSPSPQVALKLTFPGSNPDVRIEPFEPLTTTVSYFIGSDPAQWRPDVPVWGGVRYVDLYPGVDLVLGGANDAWQFEVEPGAATEQVRMQVEGASVVALDGSTLQLAAAGKSFSVTLPAASLAYHIAGLSLQGDPLVVTVPPALRASQSPQPDDNPADLLYSTFLGGGEGESGLGIAVDGTGSAHVTGSTRSSDFPTTAGAFDPTLDLEGDAFVVKINSAGSGLVYATFLGGGNEDYGEGIAVDAAGSAYLAGSTLSANFPTTAGAFDQSHNGGWDAFAVKLSANGNELKNATFLGGGTYDYGHAISVDVAGNAYITGETGSSDFPATVGAFDPGFNGAWDAFVVKLNPNGRALTYATFVGGTGGDRGWDIAVSSSGNALLTGETRSGNFPVTPGAFDTSSSGGDAFVAQLNSVGAALVYATFLGGSTGAEGRAITVDSAGNALVTGDTRSSDFPTTPNAFDPSFNGGDCGSFPCIDAFASMLNPIGSGLVYGTFLGGSSDDTGYSVAIDGEGNAYVTGWTLSSDFPATPDAFDSTSNGSDAFVVKLNADGSALVYGTFLGGDDFDTGNSVTVDGVGSVYVTGPTFSDGFPTSPGAFDPSFNGGYGDAFVTKLDLAPYMPNVLAPIEQPQGGAFVSGAVTLRGFAIDLGSSVGAGIDAVHIYLDGPYGTGTIIGGATYGLDRPDVAAQYGERFRVSGWELAWDTTGLAPGVHRLYLYAHRTTDNAWSLMDPHPVVAPGGPARWLPIVLRQR